MKHVSIYFVSAGEGRFGHPSGDGWRSLLDLSEDDDFQRQFFDLPTLTELTLPITMVSQMARRDLPMPDVPFMIGLIERNMVLFKKVKQTFDAEACEDMLRRLRAMVAPPPRVRTRRLTPLPRHLSLVIIPEVAHGAAA